jgi:hypothetical protein
VDVDNRLLVPALEVWGLSRATTVVNQILFYSPNVVVAIVIAFVWYSS